MNTKSFSECFEGEVADRQGKIAPVRWIFDSIKFPKNPNRPSRKVKAICNIGPYISISIISQDDRSYRALYARPAQWLIDFIKSSMLAIENDSIYFEIIVHPDGDAVLWAKYNQILGSRLVCAIESASIPQGAE